MADTLQQLRIFPFKNVTLKISSEEANFELSEPLRQKDKQSLTVKQIKH